jgi:hypothetical protein
MKHIASLREGDMVQYALVDDETGELAEFARLQVPDDFTFEASALLGTNLVAVLGLNGASQKRGPGRPPGAQNKTTPTPEPRKPPGRKTATPFISREMVLDIVSQHPEGIAITEIANEATDRLGVPEGADISWAVKAVSNRLTAMEVTYGNRSEVLPYRFETIPTVKGHGVHGAKRKVIYPLAGGS